MHGLQWPRAMILKFFLGPLLPIILSAVPALAAELRLTITGVHSDKGELLIGLYDNPDGFKSSIAHAATRGLLPDSGRLIGTAIRAQRGTQSTVFTQLPPGKYAVIVIHDENDNGRMDENSLGVPTEGYGFGNGAQGFLGSPSFEAAAVTIGDTDASTSVTLHYSRAPSAQDWRDLYHFLGKTAE
jgi:uncharacterized protein (DUF2141 family)